MKCERCGCELVKDKVFEGWINHNKNDCIAALKAKLEDRPTSETKPERFEHVRKWLSGDIPMFMADEFDEEVKELLAAFDEARTIIQNYWCNGFGGVAVNGWLEKWG